MDFFCYEQSLDNSWTNKLHEFMDEIEDFSQRFGTIYLPLRMTQIYGLSKHCFLYGRRVKISANQDLQKVPCSTVIINIIEISSLHYKCKIT